jgi:DNA-binding FadR family transcriptional regulator
VFPTEIDLAKQHGVSRSVTCEAVTMLSAKELLSARARQGTLIQPTGSWNLFAPDVLRWLLEPSSPTGLSRVTRAMRCS